MILFAQCSHCSCALLLSHQSFAEANAIKIDVALQATSCTAADNNSHGRMGGITWRVSQIQDVYTFRVQFRSRNTHIVVHTARHMNTHTVDLNSRCFTRATLCIKNNVPTGADGEPFRCRSNYSPEPLLCAQPTDRARVFSKIRVQCSTLVSCAPNAANCM